METNNSSLITYKAVTNALNSLFSNKHNPDFEGVAKYVLSNLDNNNSGQDFLLASILEYLYHEAPDNEQNLFMVANLINAGIIREGEEEYESDLDSLFGMVKGKDAKHIAVQHYEKFYAVTREKAESVFASCAKYLSKLCGDVIKQIYEETVVKLPENHSEFEAIHTTTNEKSLYELFGFKPDDIGFRILRSYAVDESKFESSGLEGKWEDFRCFAKVFENIETKQNYDEYYNFLQCKKIIEDISSNDGNLRWKRYRDTEGALMKLNLNRETAIYFIKRFCNEIGVICEDVTAEEYEDYEKQQTKIRQDVQKKVIELKEIQNKIDTSWGQMNKDINNFYSNLVENIEYTEKQVSDIKNNTRLIYKEEEKIKKLYVVINEFKGIKKKVEKLHGQCVEIKEIIADKVDSAEYQEGTISLEEDNAKEVFSEVSSIYDDVFKYKEPFRQLENESKNLQISQVNSLKNQFYSKIKEINETRAEILTKNIQEQKKPITKWFVWGQVFLLIVFCISYFQKLYNPENLSGGFFGVNIIAFICYISLVIRQFNKYNQAVKEKNDLFMKKEDYYPAKKLISSIALACIFFAFVQFIFLLVYNHLFESLDSGLSAQIIISIIAFAYILIYFFIKKRKK